MAIEGIERMAYTEIRPARAEDRDAVLAFCSNTWDWGDYIEYVWDEWLQDTQGLLLVAVVNEQPVGIAHLKMLNATDAWLEGMRVDPAYRRHGIASALNTTMLAEAMKRGATKAGLIIESTNTSSISLSERVNFYRVGSYALYRATPEAAATRQHYGTDTPQLATQEDIDDIIDYLNASNIFPAVGGLYYYSFVAYSITGELLAQKIAAQQVYILRRWDRLDGLAIAEPRLDRRGHQLSIGYIDGTTESISLLAYYLRHHVLNMELDKVTAYVPDLMMVRDAFVGAEYEWDGKLFYTYERGLV
jgi:ribosomal protein S18 acetylase RimI-like enzyme